MGVRTIRKALAGVQDLFFGERSVQQTRGQGSYTIDGIRGFWPVNTQTELDELNANEHPKAVLVTSNGIFWYSHNGTSYVLVDVRGQHGTTAERPTTGNFTGRQFFDTTTDSLVIWNGTSWV